MGNTKLKTFKLYDDEISELKRLSKKHGISETDIIRLSLEVMRRWSDGEIKFELTVMLPEIVVTRESGKRERLVPFYSLDGGEITKGGLSLEWPVKLKFTKSRVDSRELLRELVLRENEKSKDKIISYKLNG